MLNRLRIAIGLLVCGLAGSGCAGLLNQPPPAKSYFAIDPGSPPQASLAAEQDPAPHRPVLLVRALHVSPPYDGLPFVYRIGPSQFDTDYYNNFIAPPASLLTGAMIRWLAGATPLTVSDASTDLPHDLVLEGNITDLYIDSTDRASPKAVITGRFFVMRDHDAVVTLAGIKQYHVDAPVPARSAAGFAQAWGEAYHKLLARLAADLTGIAQDTQSHGRTR